MQRRDDDDAETDQGLESDWIDDGTALIARTNSWLRLFDLNKSAVPGKRERRFRNM